MNKGNKKLYLPVKKKTNLSTNWKTKLKQGANWGIKQWKQISQIYWEERKERKERIDMQSYIEVDEEDLYTLKINCKGKRTVGRANKRVNLEK